MRKFRSTAQTLPLSILRQKHFILHAISLLSSCNIPYSMVYFSRKEGYNEKAGGFRVGPRRTDGAGRIRARWLDHRRIVSATPPHQRVLLPSLCQPLRLHSGAALVLGAGNDDTMPIVV